jgi:ATP-binding cassette subfamily B protein
MGRLASIVDRYGNAHASGVRICGLMDLPVRIEDPPEPKPLGEVAGRIAFEDVSFSYQDGRSVLSGVSFSAEPGQTIGVVGPTGAGKSMLGQLLLRLYDVDSGAIRLDDQDVREVAQGELRRSIGYAIQETFLFDGGIAENIRYGRFDAPSA